MKGEKIEKENNMKKYFDVATIADNFMKELKIGVNYGKIKDNLEILTNFDLSCSFGELVKDTLLADFTDEQIKEMADALKNGYTTIYPPFGCQNRERTPEYNKALKKVLNSVSTKLNSQTAKEEFVAKKTKHGDDNFEFAFGMSSEKFYDTARDLFNSVFNGKTFSQTSGKNKELQKIK